MKKFNFLILFLWIFYRFYIFELPLHHCFLFLCFWFWFVMRWSLCSVFVEVIFVCVLLNFISLLFSHFFKNVQWLISIDKFSSLLHVLVSHVVDFMNAVMGLFEFLKFLCFMNSWHVILSDYISVLSYFFTTNFLSSLIFFHFF